MAGVLCCILAVATIAGATRLPSIPVFGIGEAGYFCIKIPYLFVTRNGTLLAFAEARYQSCSDFAATDLVWKRSTDNGTTWSKLAVVYGNSSVAHGVINVIGNAAPVQPRSGTRILLPFCRNNLQVLQTHSDDDGLSWAPPVAVPGGTRTAWQWVGTGPPGAIQMASGRLVVPGYHSEMYHQWDGTITRAHLMLNDHDGDPDKWYLGATAPGIQWTNENQVVELEPGHLLTAARGELTQRIQIESFDGGLTYQFPVWINITQPLGGCEGSIINHRKVGKLFFSQTINTNPERLNMTVWTSDDQGKSWQLGLVVDTGRTAYSSLQVMPDGHRVGLLYERSNATDFIFLPTEISFLVVWPFPTKK